MTSTQNSNYSLTRRAAITLCLATSLFFALRAASPNAQATRVAPAVSDLESIDIVDSDTEFTTCNIEDIQAGDLVLARDEHGHDIGLKPVKEVYKRTSYHLRHLTFESADGNQQTISTTDEHPFWSVTADEFLEAGSLPVGHEVTDPHGKTQVLVSSTREEFPNGIPVFNFQVEDFHTYYVAAKAGNNELLVHNADCSLPSYPIGKTLIEEPSVTKILDKMGTGQRQKVDALLDQIAHGGAGRNIHPLRGDLAGHFAADIPGSGKGRGALRLIFQDTDIGIILKNIEDYH